MSIQLTPAVLEVTGKPGSDDAGHAPDAIVVLIDRDSQPTELAVTPIAKTAARDHDANWFRRSSLAHVSEQFQLSGALGPVSRVRVVGVWLNGGRVVLLSSLTPAAPGPVLQQH